MTTDTGITSDHIKASVQRAHQRMNNPRKTRAEGTTAVLQAVQARTAASKADTDKPAKAKRSRAAK